MIGTPFALALCQHLPSGFVAPCPLRSLTNEPLRSLTSAPLRSLTSEPRSVTRPPGQAVQCVDHVLTGEEALALQGFDYTLQSRAPDLHKWSQKEKIDLAGNAFSASSVLPLLVALATWAPLPAAFEARVSDQGEVTAYGQQDSMDGVALSQASDGAEEGGEEETQSQPDSVHSCESGVSVAD